MLGRFLPLSLVAGSLLTSGLSAQAKLGVLHGIPGLPAQAEVFVNDASAFKFDYGEFQGPLTLPAGTYKVEVKVNSQTALGPANITLADGKNYTAVAHLKAASGINLSLYENDLANLAGDQSRVIVHHTAKAPVVDVYAKRGLFGKPVKLLDDLANPDARGGDVKSGPYGVWLTPADSTKVAFGPAWLALRARNFYGVYAIGELGTPSFRLYVQTISTIQPPALVGLVRGTACGGKIGISTSAPEFGTPFQVTLDGGTKDGFGLFHAGNSDSRLLFLPLPLKLDGLGLKGCTLYQSTEMIAPVKLDSAGKASRAVTIPAAMAPWFRELHFQYSFLDKQANPLGLVLTDYASVEKKM